MGRVAYTVVPLDQRRFAIGCCVRGEQGYHPVDDYGPYVDEARAQGVVDRLNARIRVSPAQAKRIVQSTMVKATLASSARHV